MPIADFTGRRNWGYDGVLPYAPDTAYGTPDDLKALIDEAHGLGLMVLLDVVYNHFGPEGNYLSAYSPFFTDDVATPWGPAIDFARREVRDFFIHNALYWLEEYRFDGLRFDAVHAIADQSTPHFLEELAATVRASTGRERHIHLILENENNEARRLVRDRAGKSVAFDAQWNDDWHHCAHVLLTGEADAYYADFADRPLARLARSLAEGFVYQGEPFPIHDGKPRGRAQRLPAAHGLRRLPPEPRSGRQPGHGRAALGSGAARGGGGAHGGPAAPAGSADAVHGRGVGHDERRSASSPISTTSWPTPCARAGGASSRSSRPSPTREARALIPDPNALETFTELQAAMARGRGARGHPSAGAGQGASGRTPQRTCGRGSPGRWPAALRGTSAAMSCTPPGGSATVASCTCWPISVPSRRKVSRHCPAELLWASAPEVHEAAAAGHLPGWAVMAHLDRGR